MFCLDEYFVTTCYGNAAIRRNSNDWWWDESQFPPHSIRLNKKAYCPITAQSNSLISYYQRQANELACWIPSPSPQRCCYWASAYNYNTSWDCDRHTIIVARWWINLKHCGMMYRVIGRHNSAVVICCAFLIVIWKEQSIKLEARRATLLVASRRSHFCEEIPGKAESRASRSLLRHLPTRPGKASAWDVGLASSLHGWYALFQQLLVWVFQPFNLQTWD